MLLFMKRCISLLWSFKVLWASVSINIWSLRDSKTRTTEEVDRYDNSSDTALVPTGIADARPRSADREPSRSVTQLVLKEEATDLNRRAPVDRRTDEQRADHAALAIDARVDTADAFTA